MYSVKARAILHAHLSRIELNPDTLDKDRQIIVQKCPYLIQEMVSCVNQLIMLAYARRSKCRLTVSFNIINIHISIWPLNNIFIYSFKAAEHRNHWELHEIVTDDHSRIVGIQKPIFAVTICDRWSFAHVFNEKASHQKFATICPTQTGWESARVETSQRFWIRTSDAGVRQNATHRFQYTLWRWLICKNLA